MPCSLTPDPAGIRDFLVAPAAQVTMFADSDSGTVQIVAATLNSTAQQVDDTGNVTWTAATGINLLDLAFAGSDPDEVFRIKEDCGGGNSQILTTWKLQAGGGFPGGPTRAF